MTLALIGAALIAVVVFGVFAGPSGCDSEDAPRSFTRW